MTIRKQFIVDAVEKYKKDYADEYKIFVEYVKDRKDNMEHKKFAQIKGTSEIRAVVSLPARMRAVLDYVLKDERIFEPKGELKWFLKKYPEFMLPNQY